MSSLTCIASEIQIGIQPSVFDRKMYGEALRIVVVLGTNTNTVAGNGATLRRIGSINNYTGARQLL